MTDQETGLEVRPTVANWVEEYKRPLFKRLAPSIHSSTSRWLETFALWFGTKPMTKDLVGKFFENQMTRKVKESTLVRQFNTIKLFIRWCQQMGYIASDMTFLVPSLRAKLPPPRKFTPDQYAALKEATKGTVWYYASIMAYRTGMRLSDVCLARWDSIDLDKLCIAYMPFKTRRSEIRAVCPIEAGGDLHQVLLDLEKTRLPNSQWREYVCPELAMYYPKEGGLLPLRTFGTYCRRIGAKHLSFHKLRNSFMSRAVDADMNWMKVCQITGLRTLSVMLRYANPDVDSLRKDMEKLSRREAEQAMAAETKLLTP